MTLDGFDLLGAELAPDHVHLSWTRSTVALAAGTVAALLWRKHPVLAFLGAAAVTSNAHAAAVGDRTWRGAMRKLGRHIVATAGSLALPTYPAIGYIAGAVAGDLLIDGDGGGIIEEWAQHAGVEEPRRVEIVDVTPVKPDNQTKALVKT
jgi:hypothetical protein